MRQSIFFRIAIYSFACLIISSCSSYKQNIMFKVPEGYALAKQVDSIEKNYIIQKYDYLALEVYTNKGERIVDPDAKLSQSNSNLNNSKKEEATYLITYLGSARFPMVGEVKLEGLTLSEAENILSQVYNHFYTDSFVRLKYTNKRVVVLGAPGSGGSVVPLLNENMKLTEVLAQAKGLNYDSKAKSIRVLRGDQAFVVDLSTLEGFFKNNMIMEPGDIVYVEPVRRPFSEGLRDNIALLSVLTSLSTLVLVLTSL